MKQNSCWKWFVMLAILFLAQSPVMKGHSRNEIGNDAMKSLDWFKNKDKIQMKIDSEINLSEDRYVEGYHQSEALKYLLHSSAAYCHNVAFWKCLACRNLTEFRFFTQFYNQSANVLGYLGHYPQVDGSIAMIAFRGTLPGSLQNWIDNLRFGKTEACFGIQGSACHTGMYESYLAIRNRILFDLNVLLSLLPSNVSLNFVITGHSLGGALATLCSLDLARNFNANVTTFTFGAPRIGNQVISDTYRKLVPNTWRLVHGRDIVPHLPPRLLSFSHVTTEVWYPCHSSWCSNEEVVCAGNNGEDPKCSDSQLEDLSVMDHLYYFGIHVGGYC